jgi:hypothetical protein
VDFVSTDDCCVVKISASYLNHLKKHIISMRTQEFVTSSLCLVIVFMQVQMCVTEPNISTAANLRTNTLSFNIACMFKNIGTAKAKPNKKVSKKYCNFKINERFKSRDKTITLRMRNVCNCHGEKNNV